VHQLPNAHGVITTKCFDPHPAIAIAWLRLVQGIWYPSDLHLLQHELLEEILMWQHKLEYLVAHELANSVYNWYAEAMQEDAHLQETSDQQKNLIISPPPQVPDPDQDKNQNKEEERSKEEENDEELNTFVQEKLEELFSKQGTVIKDFYKEVAKMQHIFSKNHMNGDIMSLGENKKIILQKLLEIIK
jgi:hypothetical protein